jgi:Phage uncharacterised protein (Phage_XkdX)
MFERIAAWHRKGLWTDTQVHAAADRGWITHEQADQILNPPPNPDPDPA